MGGELHGTRNGNGHQVGVKLRMTHSVLVNNATFFNLHIALVAWIRV